MGGSKTLPPILTLAPAGPQAGSIAKKTQLKKTMCAEQGKKTQGEEESAEENYVFTPAGLRHFQNGVDTASHDVQIQSPARHTARPQRPPRPSLPTSRCWH